MVKEKSPDHKNWVFTLEGRSIKMFITKKITVRRVV